MRRNSHKKECGFILLTVVVGITLVAAIALALGYQGARETSTASGELQRDQLRYVADAGFQHALSQVRDANCSNYASITNEPFGAHSYSVVVTPTDGSPVTFQSTSALDSGANMTVQRSATTVYSAASMQSVTFQPGPEGDDAEIWDQAPNNNYGNSAETWVSSASNDTTRSLLRFNIDAIPAGAIVLEATLSLLRQSGSGADQPVSAHRIRNPWSEDGVTWNSRESGTNWDTAGGDVENIAVATTPVGPVNQRYEWSITPLVQGWVDGSYPNYGVALIAAIGGMSGERFYTSDEANVDRRPSLSVTYACECGQPCAAEGSTNRLLFVVTDAATPVADEIDRQTLVESWGYVVTRISDEDSQANFDAAVSANDLAYISGDSLYNNVGTKLKAATIGVAYESYQLNNEFGLSPGGIALANLQSITITDNSHYITSPYSGSVNITTSNQRLSAVSSFAPDTQMQLLGSIPSYDGAIATLNTGDLDHNSEIVAGRRVKLPWGDTDWGFDFSSLSADGQDILKRSLEWIAGAEIGGGPKKVLFVVGSVGGAGPTTEELAHQALIEAWGHTVELIDDDASQAEFDAAAANNDVAYATNDITASRLSTKLVGATIGVVTSEDNLSDEFGMSSSIGWENGIVVEINDNTHYITSPFATGLLTVFSGSESLAYVTGTLSPDLGQLASSASGYGIVTLDTGASMYGGGTAAGRRVQLPWGGSPALEPNDLTADGLTLLQRALEWGAGAGSVSTFETRIGAGNDDSEQRTGDGYADPTSSDLELAYDIDGFESNLVGMRFTGVAVPQGAAISNAYIQFQVDELKSSATSLSINGQNIDSAAPFTSTDFDISDRATTAASVPWVIPLWNTVGDAGPDQRTPNIASVIQEIVGRPGWSSGNALVVMVTGTGTRTAEAYDGDSNGAPLLHIEYGGAGGGGGTAPVAHWRLDETSGTTAVDSAGGHDGTLVNSPTWATGYLDGALDMDGNNDYVDIPHDDTLSLTETMTFTAWINASNFGSSYQTILAKDGGGSGSNYYFGTWQQDFDFGFYSGGLFREVFTSGLNLQAGTWYHLAASFDNSTGQVLLYVDGIQVRDGLLSFSPTVVKANIAIGRSPDGERWAGLLDDVRIYDQILSGADIAELAAESGSGGGDGGSCDGTFRDEFNQESYANNDGTLEWSTEWLEINETDGWDSGDERVDDNDSDYHLQVRDNDRGGEGVQREADLSGSTSAKFTYEYRRDGFDNSSDYVMVQISRDGGSSWVELERISGPGTDSSYVPRSHDISKAIASDTRVRFLTSPNLGSGDELYVDNIEIVVSGCAD